MPAPSGRPPLGDLVTLSLKWPTCLQTRLDGCRPGGARDTLLRRQSRRPDDRAGQSDREGRLPTGSLTTDPSPAPALTLNGGALAL